MPKIKVNNININFEMQGEGKPLVFVPGLGGDSKLYFFQKPYFSNFYKTIIIDNRGAGDSDKPKGPYTMKMLSDDLKVLLDSLNINEKIYLVGASMGGLIAQSFMMDYPEKVEKLVLACSGVSGADPHYVPMSDEIALEISNPNATREDAINLIVNRFYHPNYVEKNPGLKEMFLSLEPKCPKEAYLAQLAACVDTRDYYGRLREINVPSLVMHGKEDMVWPLRNAEVLKEGIGDNAQLYIMDDAAHMFMQEKYELFNKVLHDFLKQG
jgi:pimeloyl-ACP methyl ester carboxylesterase